jgi:hypothetical protein
MVEKARGIVREFLKTRGMELDQFRRLRKGHPDKIAIAGELRKSTTMTMAWIAEELNAGMPQTLWRALWKTGKSDNTRDPFYLPPAWGRFFLSVRVGLGFLSRLWR